MKRRKAILALALTMCATVLAGGSVFAASAQGADAAQSYMLYTSEKLAEKTGGKIFSIQTPDEAQILCVDGSGDGTTTDAGRKVASGGNNSGAYFCPNTDTDYAYNAGNIGTTPAGTNTYQTWGAAEVFFEQYPGPVQRGGEWLLDEPIDTAEFSSITVDVSYITANASTAPSGDDREGEVVLYALGEDENGARKVISQKASFGINYWSTGVLELDGLQTVTRIAVSVLWGTISQQQGSGAFVYLSRFAVHARAAEAEERVLTANNMDLDFFNGNNGGRNAAASLSGMNTRVYHSDGGYAAMGGFDAGEYIYGTQRITVGNYVILQLKDPVHISDFRFLDLELLAYPQIADGPWQAETANNFYFDALRPDADDASSGTRFELSKRQWATCRIELADYADENGYVTKIALVYAANDSGREPAEEGNYSIQFGIHNAKFTSYEETEMIAYSIGAPQVSDSSVDFRIKTSVAFAYGDEPSDEFLAAVTLNGQTFAQLLQEGKLSVEFRGYFISVSADRSLFRMDDTDTVCLQAGKDVRGGVLKTKYDEEFVYYASLDRFELSPDEDALDLRTEISLELVEMGTVDEVSTMYGNQNVTENSIFVTFSHSMCLNGDNSHMQLPMEEMAQTANASEDYVFELARRGVIRSCMDLLYVNGKSVREWLAIDLAEGKEGLIRISFMDEWNWGKTLRVMAANTSNLQLGAGKEMSIEFKAGFTTPMGKYIAEDMYAHIDAEDAVSVNSVFDLQDKATVEAGENAAGAVVDNQAAAQAEGKGCSAAVSFAAGVPALVVTAAAVVACRKKEGGKR